MSRLNEVREIRDTLREIRKALGENLSIRKSSTKEAKALASISRRITDAIEEGNSATDRQLAKDAERARSSLRELQRQADIAQAKKDSLDATQQLSDEEKELLAAKEAGFKIEEKVVRLSEKELRIRKGVNRSLGVTGALAKSLSKTFNIDLGDALQDARDKAEEINREFEDSGKTIIDVGKKTAGNAEVALLNLKGLTGAALDGISSTEFIFSTILNQALSLNKAQTEFRTLSGQSVENFKGVNSELVTATDQVKNINALSKELGVNVNAAFSPETLFNAAVLANNLDVSERSAANLALRAEVFGGEFRDAAKSAELATEQVNSSGKGAVLFGDVLESAGNASDALALSLDASGKSLFVATAEARKLGLTLDQVDSIAESLLNFESSIAAELEAELFTGRELNLERARFFALTNDVAGLTEEIASNQDVLNAFASENRLAQNAIAKSLGLSRDELAKTIVIQKLNAGLTAEQAAAAANVSPELAKSLDIQEKFQKSIQSLTDAITPFVEKLALILDNTTALYGIVTLIAATRLTKLIRDLTIISALSTTAGRGVGGLAAGGGALTTAGGAATAGSAGRGLLGRAGAGISRLGLPGLLVGGALLGGAFLLNRNKRQQEERARIAAGDRINDGIIGSDGSLLVSGPRGSISLNSNDTIVGNKNGIIAGTNLGGSNRELIGRIDRLIAATERGTTITMDGNIVGKSVANTTSRLG